MHRYDEPCPRKKPTYRYEREGADRLRFTSRRSRSLPRPTTTSLTLRMPPIPTLTGRGRSSRICPQKPSAPLESNKKEGHLALRWAPLFLF